MVGSRAVKDSRKNIQTVAGQNESNSFNEKGFRGLDNADFKQKTRNSRIGLT
jgi:hypothetical protein